MFHGMSSQGRNNSVIFQGTTWLAAAQVLAQESSHLGAPLLPSPRDRVAMVALELWKERDFLFHSSLQRSL